jgi:hypothetical protein
VVVAVVAPLSLLLLGLLLPGLLWRQGQGQAPKLQFLLLEVLQLPWGAGPCVPFQTCQLVTAAAAAAAPAAVPVPHGACSQPGRCRRRCYCCYWCRRCWQLPGLLALWLLLLLLLLLLPPQPASCCHYAHSTSATSQAGAGQRLQQVLAPSCLLLMWHQLSLWCHLLLPLLQCL